MKTITIYRSTGDALHRLVLHESGETCYCAPDARLEVCS